MTDKLWRLTMILNNTDDYSLYKVISEIPSELPQLDVSALNDELKAMWGSDTTKAYVVLQPVKYIGDETYLNWVQSYRIPIVKHFNIEYLQNLFKEELSKTPSQLKRRGERQKLSISELKASIAKIESEHGDYCEDKLIYRGYRRMLKDLNYFLELKGEALHKNVFKTGVRVKQIDASRMLPDDDFKVNWEMVLQRIREIEDSYPDAINIPQNDYDEHEMLVTRWNKHYKAKNANS